MEDNTIEECARRLQCTTQTVENRVKALAKQGVAIEVRRDAVDKRRRLISETDLQRIAAAYQDTLLPPKSGILPALTDLEVGVEVGGSDGQASAELVRVELEALSIQYRRELDLLRRSREQNQEQFGQFMEEARAWLNRVREESGERAQRDRSP